MNQIHGHAVLEMILASGKAYTKEGLAEEILANFGAGARFCTCSSEGLTARELIEFLDSKGKFVRTPQGLRASADLMCQGG